MRTQSGWHWIGTATAHRQQRTSRAEYLRHPHAWVGVLLDRDGGQNVFTSTRRVNGCRAHPPRGLPRHQHRAGRDLAAEKNGDIARGIDPEAARGGLAEGRDAGSNVRGVSSTPTPRLISDPDRGRTIKSNSTATWLTGRAVLRPASRSRTSEPFTLKIGTDHGKYAANRLPGAAVQRLQLRKATQPDQRRGQVPGEEPGQIPPAR